MEKEKFIQYYTDAFAIATKAHLSQKDIGGKPYILHPIEVARHCISDKAKIVAILHDVIEDSDIQIEDIRKIIPDEEILSAIVLLTKTVNDRKGVGYVEYLKRIKANEIACEVKIADLMHNMDLSRIPQLSDWDRRRQIKYRNSLDFLLGKTDEYKY